MSYMLLPRLPFWCLVIHYASKIMFDIVRLQIPPVLHFSREEVQIIDNQFIIAYCDVRCLIFFYKVVQVSDEDDFMGYFTLLISACCLFDESVFLDFFSNFLTVLPCFFNNPAWYCSNFLL